MRQKTVCKSKDIEIDEISKVRLHEPKKVKFCMEFKNLYTKAVCFVI